MNYLRTFNQKLRDLRRNKKLTKADVALFCQVDEMLVDRWEAYAETQRSLPTLEQLFDLCIKSDTQLATLLEIESATDTHPQLDLLSIIDEGPSDIDAALSELGDALTAALPDEQERDILRRLRNCDDEKRQFIMQLLPVETSARDS